LAGGRKNAILFESSLHSFLGKASVSLDLRPRLLLSQIAVSGTRHAAATMVQQTVTVWGYQCKKL